MLIWIAVFCVITSLCIILCRRKKLNNFKDWGIPQPNEWPILGYFGQNIYRRKTLSELIKEIYNIDKEAKYVGAHAFTVPMLVLRDIDLIKAVLVRDFDYFSDRKVPLNENTDPLLARNLAALNGHVWREVRNLLSPAFTSSKMKSMFELMTKCAENFTDRFIEQFNDKQEINMKDAFAKYTNDTIATCAFGIEVDSLKNPDNEFYVYGKQISNNEGWAQIIGVIKMLFIVKFPRVAKALGIQLMPNKIKDFFVNVIESTMKTRDEKGIVRPDMLQLMMDARGKTSEQLKLDIVDITAQALVFFLGGFETTSSQMCLIAHEVAINPDVQEKLHAEIDAISDGNGGNVTYETIANMPYLDCVFNESMRKHPQAAFLSRVCSKPYELPPALPGAKPYLVQSGMEVFVPVVGIHEDPQFYDQPKKFMPERFLGKKVTSGDVTSLGFGLGPRMCIGNRFAILETKVLFFYLLKKCTLVPCSRTCIPLKYSNNKLGPFPKEGFWLRMKKR